MKMTTTPSWVIRSMVPRRMRRRLLLNLTMMNPSTRWNCAGKKVACICRTIQWMQMAIDRGSIPICAICPKLRLWTRTIFRLRTNWSSTWRSILRTSQLYPISIKSSSAPRPLVLMKKPKNLKRAERPSKRSSRKEKFKGHQRAR